MSLSNKWGDEPDLNVLVHTPLMEAVAKNDRQQVKWLLTGREADVNETTASTKHGDSTYALFLTSSVDMVRELTSNGADPTVTDMDGNSVLHLASSRDPEIMNELLKAGCDPNVRNAEGDTPLHVLVASVDADVAVMQTIEVLLKGNNDVGKADPNSLNLMGVTPLFASKVLESPELMQMLFEYGADPNVAQDEDGKTPLHLVDTPEMMEILLEAEGNARGARDADGKTAYPGMSASPRQFVKKSTSLLSFAAALRYLSNPTLVSNGLSPSPDAKLSRALSLFLSPSSPNSNSVQP